MLKDFVRKGGITKEYPTVQGLITSATKEGWKLKADAETGNPIQLSKAGNAQLVFEDKDKDRVYVRVSDNALDAISAGEEPLQLPVYKTELHEDGDVLKPVIGSMLVIGIIANNEGMVDANMTDLAKLFKAPVQTVTGP